MVIVLNLNLSVATLTCTLLNFKVKVQIGGIVLLKPIILLKVTRLAVGSDSLFSGHYF